MIGHENTKKQLEVAINSAKQRNMALPHMLFSGAAGCGKTSLAMLVAEQTNSPFLSVVPNDLKDYESVINVLEQLDHTSYDEMGNRTGTIKPTVLFLDEVHNLPLKGQELLGLVMERFVIESGKPNLYHWVPFFTLVGATTIAGKLSKPFRDRFKLVFSFQPYDLPDMMQIVMHHAKRIGIKLTMQAAGEVAKRSRGIPRIAVGFIERVRDRMLSISSVIGTVSLVSDVFEEIGIDSEGFTKMEIKLLSILLESGMPVGLDNLSIILQEDPKSIRDFAEPFLIRKGLLLVSGKGRIITERGKQYLSNAGKVDRLMKKTVAFNHVRG